MNFLRTKIVSLLFLGFFVSANLMSVNPFIVKLLEDKYEGRENGRDIEHRCSICDKDILRKEHLTAPCGHQFHIECIFKELIMCEGVREGDFIQKVIQRSSPKGFCPVCNTQLTKDSLIGEDENLKIVVEKILSVEINSLLIDSTKDGNLEVIGLHQINSNTGYVEIDYHCSPFSIVIDKDNTERLTQGFEYKECFSINDIEELYEEFKKKDLKFRLKELKDLQKRLKALYETFTFIPSNYSDLLLINLHICLCNDLYMKTFRDMKSCRDMKSSKWKIYLDCPMNRITFFVIKNMLSMSFSDNYDDSIESQYKDLDGKELTFDEYNIAALFKYVGGSQPGIYLKLRLNIDDELCVFSNTRFIEKICNRFQQIEYSTRIKFLESCSNFLLKESESNFSISTTLITGIIKMIYNRMVLEERSAGSFDQPVKQDYRIKVLLPFLLDIFIHIDRDNITGIKTLLPVEFDNFDNSDELSVQE